MSAPFAMLEPCEEEVVAMAPAMLASAIDTLEVPTPMSPSELAAEYRKIKPGTSFRSGPWSNEIFPYLTAIMDLIQEAVETGKRGVVLMKSGQGGGSEAMINALNWLRVFFSGPILYLISTETIAKEFSRDRFDFVNQTFAPIAKKCISGYGSGTSLTKKRYTDGKLVLAGGQSIFNIESLPYPFVFVDEPDSLPEKVKDKGDPLKVAEVRVDGWIGVTLIVAFSHPTTKHRGTGKLYYSKSDQRRGFVSCPHCPTGEFWLDPEQIMVFPKDGQSQTAAERDPDCYQFVTPCCGVILTDAERIAAVARGCEQKTTLSPEEAETKYWIGAHFSQLYMSNKTMRQLAVEVIQGLDDESTKVVVVNKRWGDVYEGDVDGTPLEDWRALRVQEGSEFHYHRGQVPEEVQFLLGGQDSRLLELHWSVWGFGVVRAEGGHPLLCMWLVDFGVEPGPKAIDPKRSTIDSADLAVLDQVLYESYWPHASGGHIPLSQCWHDSGFQPTAVNDYCLFQRPRAVPTKGAALNESSKAPLVRWSAPLRWRVGSVERHHPEFRRADLNTFKLKLNFHGMAQRRFVDQRGRERCRIYLPEDTPEEFLAHLASERLEREGNTRVWKKSGPNHWLDTAIGALAASGQAEKLVGPVTRAEAQRKADAERLRQRRKPKSSIRTRY